MFGECCRFCGNAMSWFIFPLLFAAVTCRDISFKDCPGNDFDCTLPYLDLSCDESGTVSTIKYDDDQYDDDNGVFRVQFRSCPASIIHLTLKDQDFDLTLSSNSFSVGNGIVVDDLSLILPVLKGDGQGGNELPDNLPSYTYSSSANEMWMKYEKLGFGGKFRVYYQVEASDIKEYIYTDWKGVLNSNNAIKPYPELMEEHHLINVTDANFLRLSIDSLEICGSNGDYLEIMPGSGISELSKSALISWILEEGTQFVIDSNAALLVFKTFQKKLDQDCAGFSISYEAIVDNRTTPVPTTTDYPRTTPLPLNPDLLLTPIVWLNYTGSRVEQLVIAELLNDYIVSDPTFLQGWNLTSPLSYKSIQIYNFKPCNGRWYVDTKTCRQIEIMVDSFKTNGTFEEYTFLRHSVVDAIHYFPVDKYQITVPGEITDVYTYAIIICVIAVLLIIVLLIFVWIGKLKMDATEQRRYTEIVGSKRSPKEKLDSKDEMVFENAAFQFDEEHGPTDSRMFDPVSRTIRSSLDVFEEYQSRNNRPTAMFNLDGSISSSEYGSGSYASSVSSSVSKRSQRHEPLNVSGIIKNSAYVQSNPGASFPQDDPDLDEVVLYDDDQNSWSTEDRYNDARRRGSLFLGNQRDSIGETNL